MDNKPKNWEDRLTLFVGYLVQCKKKSTTIKSYISAIKAVLAAEKIKISEDAYLISFLTKVCRITNDKIRTRLPIYKKMVNVLLDRCETYFGKKQQVFQAKLYRAVFVSMYYGMLRISEVTEGEHAVKALDVHIADNKNKILFILRSSKTHTRENKPQIITIMNDKSACTTKDINHCPFVILNEYLACRPSCKSFDKQFFVFQGRLPLKASHLRATLCKLLKQMKVNHKIYGSHNLHKGRTKDLLKLGYSIEKIKKLGHWKSNTVYTYLR